MDGSHIGNLSLADKWILTRLSKLIKETNKNFDEFKFLIEGLISKTILKSIFDYFQKFDIVRCFYN